MLTPPARRGARNPRATLVVSSAVAFALLANPVAAAAQRGAGGSQSTPAGASVTLAEAIRRAERVQPDVAQARAAVQTAGAEVRNAWGAWLPTVTVSSTGIDFFSEGSSRVDPVTGQVTTGNSSNKSVSAAVAASLDLFTGFRRGADMRAARAGATAADASFIDARYQQALTTTNQFFDALAARELVRVRGASVARAEEQLKVATNKLHAGSATRSDSLRSLVNLGTAQLDRLDAERDLATAEANLGRLIGATGRVQAADDSAFYDLRPTVDTAALRVEVEAQSPQVRSAAASATAARASLSASKAAYWPSLTLSANSGWNGSQINDYDLLNQRQVSLRLSWNLFNGFGRELAIAQARANAEVGDARASESRRRVLADLTSQLAELDAAEARIGITRTSVAAATEDVRVQQERYRVGLGTIVELLTSQEALSQAEVDLVNARFQYLRAKAQLEALAGHAL